MAPQLPGPDPRSTFAARWLLGCAVAGVVAAGLGLVESARSASSLVVEATTVADAAAHTWATRSDDKAGAQALTGLLAGHPAAAELFVVVEGGVDEFGISRGTALAYGKVADVDAKALLDHAKTVTADATRALASATPMTAEALQLHLPDGRLVVAAPLREGPKGKTVSGVAGTLMKPRAASALRPLWLAVVLAALLAGATAAARNRARLLFDAAAIAGMGLLWWVLQPTLAAQPASGIAVLGGDLLVPHAAPSAAEPLTILHVAVGAALLAVAGAWAATPLARVLDGARKDVVPYLYVGPAMAATTLLIFVPFAVGVGLSFVDKSGAFVGLAHYAEVLQSITDPNSSTHFGRTLVMTILWTVVNVGLHVTIGLGLALVLNRPHLRGRALYRLLLIVPWAVPSYITALTWKWLFNTQAGPLNAMLVALGQDRVDWLGTSPWTNFAANLATNVWLGFPFMMVISLGALQSIPSELYEAADMDGGSGWQKFRHITLPLLRPALFPAIILGTIWTFNAFNVIWLVSGGGPDHQTDILITEAYYTFTVLRRTGLAAAYSVLIFLMLLGYTLVTNRLTRATQAVGA